MLLWVCDYQYLYVDWDKNTRNSLLTMLGRRMLLFLPRIKMLKCLMCWGTKPACQHWVRSFGRGTNRLDLPTSPLMTPARILSFSPGPSLIVACLCSFLSSSLSSYSSILDIYKEDGGWLRGQFLLEHMHAGQSGAWPINLVAQACQWWPPPTSILNRLFCWN